MADLEVCAVSCALFRQRALFKHDWNQAKINNPILSFGRYIGVQLLAEVAAAVIIVACNVESVVQLPLYLLSTLCKCLPMPREWKERFDILLRRVTAPQLRCQPHPFLKIIDLASLGLGIHVDKLVCRCIPTITIAVGIVCPRVCG